MGPAIAYSQSWRDVRASCAGVAVWPQTLPELRRRLPAALRRDFDPFGPGPPGLLGCRRAENCFDFTGGLRLVLGFAVLHPAMPARLHARGLAWGPSELAMQLGQAEPAERAAILLERTLAGTWALLGWPQPMTLLGDPVWPAGFHLLGPSREELALLVEAGWRRSRRPALSEEAVNDAAP